MNLAHLAAGYKYRRPGPRTIARARLASQRRGVRMGEWAADIGGGQGTHAAVWVDDGVRPVVIDPERAMVGAARSRGIDAILGTAQHIPLADDTVAFAYSHLAIHYDDWKKAVDEQMRIVRPSGTCWVWTMTARHLADPYLAKWFPSVVALDAGRFPAGDDIAARFRGHGATVERIVDLERMSRTASEFLAAVTDQFISTLQLISKEEFDRGLQRLHDDLHGIETVDYTVEYDGIIATV